MKGKRPVPVRFKPAVLLCCLAALLRLLWLPVPAESSEAPGIGSVPERPLGAHRLRAKDGDAFVVLQNGLTVLVRSKPGGNAVSARVLVRAGSIYEGPYLTGGLSHYLEHVVFSGTTKSFTEDQARKRLEELGGASNAYTSHDRTVYFINTSAENWREALDLLLSFVLECTLDPAETAREKAVIQQEIRMGENSPQRELWKLFMQTAYRVHPVRHPVIGYEEVFVRQDREALARYYDERYQPQNMVLAVAGDVDPWEVVRFAADKTRSVARSSAEPLALPEEPPQLTSRWEEKALPMARMNQAMVGFPSVRLTHEDLYALDVLAIVVGDGRTGRLYRRLKHRDNSVLDVGAFNWTPSYVPGQFVISLTVPPENWPRVLDAVREELSVIKEYGIDDEELERAKKKVIAQHVFGKETASEAAASIGGSYFDTGDPYFEDSYVEGIRAVTRDDVRRTARKYLVFDRMNVAVITPGEDSVSPSATPPGASSSAETPDETESVIVRRPANGLTVLMREDHELPYATVQIYTRGGLLLEKEGEEGLAAMTGSLLTAGTRRYSKMEMAEKIENVGGSLNSGCGNNTCFVSSKVLREDLESALDLVSSALLEPVFPEEEIEKKRKETLLAIERQDEDWQAELMRLFRSHFFGSHPYGHNRLGTEASVKRFTREDILAFHARMARPERTVVAVYGDFRAGEAEKTVEKLFGKWRGEAAGEPTRPGPVPLLTEDRVIVKENEKTSAALFVGTNGLPLNDPRRPALDVLDALISGIGYPGGRLHEALRGGDADLVYVVHAFPFLGIDTGFFGVLTQTTMENLESVEAIVLDNLKRVAEEPVSNEEFQTAKEMVLTMHYLSLESLEAQAQSAAVNEVLGLGWDYDRRYPDMVRSVTADDILSLARELFTNTLVVKTLPVRMSRLQPRAAWISASNRWMFSRAKSMEGSSSRAMR